MIRELSVQAKKKNNQSPQVGQKNVASECLLEVCYSFLELSTFRNKLHKYIRNHVLELANK